MMKFYENREFLINEFEEAPWDDSTGKNPNEVIAMMKQYQKEHPELSPTLLRANTFELMLKNIRIDINPKGMFSFKLDRNLGYDPYAGWGMFDKFFGSRYYQISSDVMPKVWAERVKASNWGVSQPDSDYWHTCPDWNYIMRLGLPGILEAAERAKAKKYEERLLTDKAADFYDSVIISYRAMIDCVSRMAKQAESLGCKEMANCLSNLTVRPPQKLYEAMALSFIYLDFEEMGIERCRSLGFIDRLYRPFYENEIKSGELTEEDVREMFRYYFQRISAAKRGNDQPIALGGIDADGNDTTTDLTYLMLEVYSELSIHDPKIHIRCYPKMPRRLRRMALTMIRDGISSIVLINDETVFKGYEKIGIPRRLSAEYLPIGCYEPILMGVEDARIGAAWFNIAKAVEMTMHGGIDPIKHAVFGKTSDPNPPTFEDFYRIFLEYLKYNLEFTMKNIIDQLSYQAYINPSPVLSGAISSCIESGYDIFDNGMPIRNDSIKCFAIGTTVDSILAVKKFVYEKKIVTFREMAKILERNWAGAETLRKQIMDDEDKWGNNLEEPDKLARDIYNYIASILVNRTNGRGGVFRMATDSVHHDAIYGKNTGATPDGRLSGEPLTKNMRPTNGMERKGITALIQSVTAIDHTDTLDAAPLDFMLHPSAVNGEKGIDTLESLLSVYFQRGGFAFQGNVVNSKILKDAQKNPEAYQNLQVRVCGWNEYFVDMNEKVQNDFIARAEGLESV